MLVRIKTKIQIFFNLLVGLHQIKLFVTILANSIHNSANKITYMYSCTLSVPEMRKPIPTMDIPISPSTAILFSIYCSLPFNLAEGNIKLTNTTKLMTISKTKSIAHHPNGLMYFCKNKSANLIINKKT
jgi:hypothetical protein